MKGKTVVFGIGNRLRGDDGIGPFVVDELSVEINRDDVIFISSESAPENFLGKIESIGPEKLIIVDAVDFGKEPGTVDKIDINSVKKHSLTTHKMPLTVFIDYLQKKINFKLVFIGVQPKNIGFCETLSKECRDSLKKVKEMVFREINIK